MIKESELECVLVKFLLLVVVLHQLDTLNKECYSHAISILGVKVACCINFITQF